MGPQKEEWQGQQGGVRASCLALLPQRRLNGSQRQNPGGRQAALGAKSRWWEGKTQSFLWGREWEGLSSPERLSLLPQAGALGMNRPTLIGTLKWSVKFYFPEKHPATHSYLGEGSLWMACPRSTIKEPRLNRLPQFLSLCCHGTRNSIGSLSPYSDRRGSSVHGLWPGLS